MHGTTQPEPDGGVPNPNPSTEWRITYCVSVDGEEYGDEMIVNNTTMSDAAARQFAAHELHIHSSAPMERFDVTDIAVEYERVE